MAKDAYKQSSQGESSGIKNLRGVNGYHKQSTDKKERKCPLISIGRCRVAFLLAVSYFI